MSSDTSRGVKRAAVSLGQGKGGAGRVPRRTKTQGRCGEYVPDFLREAVRASSALAFCLGPMYFICSSNSRSNHQNVPSSAPPSAQAALASSSCCGGLDGGVGGRHGVFRDIRGLLGLELEASAFDAASRALVAALAIFLHRALRDAHRPQRLAVVVLEDGHLGFGPRLLHVDSVYRPIAFCFAAHLLACSWASNLASFGRPRLRPRKRLAPGASSCDLAATQQFCDFAELLPRHSQLLSASLICAGAASSNRHRATHMPGAQFLQDIVLLL